MKKILFILLLFTELAFTQTSGWQGWRGTPDYLTIQSEQLGPEKVINGDFSSSTGWTQGTGVTIQNNRCEFLSSPTGYRLYRNMNLVDGTTYKITFDISNNSAGSMQIRLGASAQAVIFTGNGHKILYATKPSDGNAYGGISVWVTFTAHIDNLSVKEVL